MLLEGNQTDRSNSLDRSVFATKKFETKNEQREYPINTSIILPDGTSFLSLECTTEQGVVISDRRQVLVGKDAMENMVALDRKDYVLMLLPISMIIGATWLSGA